MTINDVASASAALRSAEDQRQARGRITDEWTGLDLATAHQVQAETVRAKVAEGDRVVGTKLGLTSRAKQQRMGISSPLTAVLLESYVLPADVPVPLDRLIQPRVEPEIVFVMGKRLQGPGVTAATALAAVERVHAGFEVIDSRYRDYSFALPDVVADNASSACFVVGSTSVAPDQIDLLLEAVALSVNGQTVATATGAAVQGHPAEALALAANELGSRGLAIEAGEIVLTGGMTDAVPIGDGDQIVAEFTHLGALVLTGATSKKTGEDNA